MFDFFFRRGRDPKPELVPLLLPESLGAEVDEILADDLFVPAVKLVRERTGLGLVAATRAVQHRRDAS